MNNLITRLRRSSGDDGSDAHGRGHGHGPDLAARVAALETAVEENRLSTSGSPTSSTW